MNYLREMKHSYANHVRMSSVVCRSVGRSVGRLLIFSYKLQSMLLSKHTIHQPTIQPDNAAHGEGGLHEGVLQADPPRRHRLVEGRGTAGLREHRH